MPTQTITIDGQDYNAEYERTPCHAAEMSWSGGAGSPAEGGEAYGLVVYDDDMNEVPLTEVQRIAAYKWLDANPEDE